MCGRASVGASGERDRAVAGFRFLGRKLGNDGGAHGTHGAKTSTYRYEFPTGLLMNIAFIGSSIEQQDEATALAEMKTLKAMKCLA